MSLLLDALNRASKDKAAAAAVAEAAVSTPGEPSPASPDVVETHDWPTLGLSLTPADAPPVNLHPGRSSDPANTAGPVDTDMRLVAVPAAPAPQPPIHPERRTEPAVVTSPMSAPPSPTSTPKLEQRPAAAGVRPVPSNAPRVAQSILRAQAPDNRRAPPTRLIALVGIAALLAAGLGSVMLGWWGDPTAWLQYDVRPGPAAQRGPGATVTVMAPATAVEAVPTRPVTPLAAASATVAGPVAAQTPERSSAVIRPRTIARTAATERAASAPHECAPGLSLAECKAASQPKPAAAPAKIGQPALQSRSTGPSPLELGYAALTQGRLQEAAQAYTQALAGNPEERDALLGLAYIAHQQGRSEDARAFYKRVLRQEPGNPVARAGLLTLSPAEDAQELGSRSREVAEQNPDSAAAQSVLGHALARQGRLADAQLAFNRAHLLEPGVALHAFNLAVALDRLRNYGPARLYYERALTLSAQSGGERASGVPHLVVQARLEQLRATPAAAPADSH